MNLSISNIIQLICAGSLRTQTRYFYVIMPPGIDLKSKYSIIYFYYCKSILFGVAVLLKFEVNAKLKLLV